MKIEITAIERLLKGTGASRRLRHSGKTPGILYGGKDEDGIDGNLIKHETSYYTSTPEYVDDLIDIFRKQKNYFKENGENNQKTEIFSLSIAVHWRFDKQDWLKVQENNNRNDKLVLHFQSNTI